MLPAMSGTGSTITESLASQRGNSFLRGATQRHALVRLCCDVKDSATCRA